MVTGIVVLGGAKESLDAHPGLYDLTLKNRKGFVKIALEHGSSLVPVFGFGENEVFEQIQNPRGSWLRRLQDRLQTKLGFAMPLIKGRGVFQYKFGIMPHRRPIRVVVGAPIDVPKVARADITPELVNTYHTKYLEALQRLFDEYKDVYAPDRRTDLQFL
eukprot:TRINITY_DN66990_c5_g3_i4.p1 TRINITY_DN66990_c5_g3~~TRINITY_DN66990_c5_g3_i4.p1  ORF type:complete len:160 (-),score=79.35 TRINITY_DN66990_c5_g3_i4:998-1477(-)